MRHVQPNSGTSPGEALRLLLSQIGAYKRRCDTFYPFCHLPTPSPEIQPVETLNLDGRTFDLDKISDAARVRIPMLSGRAFRDEAGRDSDLKSATIPR